MSKQRLSKICQPRYNLIPHVLKPQIDNTLDWLMSEWVSEWLTDWLSHWPTMSLNDWLTDWLSEWVSEWVSEWLVIWWIPVWLINPAIILIDLTIYAFLLSSQFFFNLYCFFTFCWCLGFSVIGCCMLCTTLVITLVIFQLGLGS